MKIPKTLAACADALAKVEAEIDALKAKMKLLDEQRVALERHLVDNLPKSQASGVAGKVARAQITTEEVPTVEDWDELYKYVAKTKDFDLLQRRLSTKAVRERWELQRKVPGVGVFKKIGVKLTLLKGKEKTK